MSASSRATSAWGPSSRACWSARSRIGELIRHPGEEFIYVVKGALIVHTGCYDPVGLEEGPSLDIDSGIGHAYLCAEGHDEAVLLGLMSTSDPLPLAKAAIQILPVRVEQQGD